MIYLRSFPGHCLEGLRLVVDVVRELLRTGGSVADGLQYPGPGGVRGAGGEPAGTTVNILASTERQLDCQYNNFR